MERLIGLHTQKDSPMANQQSTAKLSSSFRSLAKTLGISFARLTCRTASSLHLNSLEDRITPSHGVEQYGYAHRVNDWDSIIDALDAGHGGGNVAANGIEVDIGWGKP
jgi:hypothetical protein